MDSAVVREAELMLCIMCMTEAPSSREHVFPEKIGGRLEIDRVCSGCNSTLGTTIDVALTDDTLVLFARHRYLGQTEALTRAFGPGVLTDGTHVLPQLDGAVAPLGLDVRGERRETRNANGTTTIQYVLPAGEEWRLPEILEREQRRREKIGESVLGHTVQELSVERPESRHDFMMDLAGVTLGLAKIAYEFTCKSLGDSYLNDPTAERFRDALRAGVPDKGAATRFPLKDFGSANVKGAVTLEPFAELPGSYHAVGLNSEDGRVLAAVRVFDCYLAGFVMSTRAANYLTKFPRAYVVDSSSGKKFEI
jgi:hypothetical protein